MTVWPHRMTRARTYVLIDAIEEDLRELLSSWAVPELGEEGTLGSYFAAASEAALIDISDPDDVNLLNYLHLQEAVALLNTHRDLLPSGPATMMKDCTATLANLSGVRNRVMHGRPLLPDDPDQVIQLANDLVASDGDMANTSDVLSRLNADSNWEPLMVSQDRSRDRVLNNLPLPDFDETGLIGRTKESRDLLQHLIKRREPVLTVVGEGGIGKTALAVKVLYDLIDHPDCPYDAVLWISLKTEALTIDGVKELADAARQLDAIAKGLASAVADDSDYGVEELADVLATSNALIVIDNLETVDSSEILHLYDAMPAQTRFLFTSRVGLGELERRIPLGALSSSDAAKFFRKLARRRGLEHLATIDNQGAAGIAGALRKNPLALRWYVLSVEAGQQPDLALDNQDELLRFCVSSVYNHLTSEARALLTDLYCLGRPVLFSEIPVLTHLDLDGARVLLHELQRSSLLETFAETSDRVVQGYAVTASTQQYIARLIPPEDHEAAEIRERDRLFRSRDEVRRREAVSEALAPHIVHSRNTTDAPVADLLAAALEMAHRGEDEWTEKIAIAEKLAPTYFEVFRVHAFIQSSMGHVELATDLYKKAYDIAESQHRSIVAYFYAGHLSRKALDPASALPYALEARQSLDDDRAELQYATTLVFLERFDEAEPLLKQVMDRAVGRSRLIAVTQMVALARRRCEWILEHEHNNLHAFATAWDGIRLGISELADGVRDGRLNDTILHTVAEALAAAREMLDLASVEADLMDLLVLVRMNQRIWSKSPRWQHCEGSIAALRGRPDLPVGVESVINSSDEEVLSRIEQRRTGRISRFLPERGFGFVQLDGMGLVDIFFSAKHLPTVADRFYCVRGVQLTFNLKSLEKGPQATRIRIDARERERAASIRRNTRVLNTSSHFAFLDDLQTGTRLYLGRDGMADSTDWSKVRVGSFVECAAYPGEKGPRVVKRSARVVSADDLDERLGMPYGEGGDGGTHETVNR